MRYLLTITLLLTTYAPALAIEGMHVSDPIYTPVPQYTITPEIEQRAAKRAAVYTHAPIAICNVSSNSPCRYGGRT